MDTSIPVSTISKLKTIRDELLDNPECSHVTLYTEHSGNHPAGTLLWIYNFTKWKLEVTSTYNEPQYALYADGELLASQSLEYVDFFNEQCNLLVEAVVTGVFNVFRTFQTRLQLLHMEGLRLTMWSDEVEIEWKCGRNKASLSYWVEEGKGMLIVRRNDEGKIKHIYSSLTDLSNRFNKHVFETFDIT